MTINKWRSKYNLNSVVTVSRETVKRELVDASPQCSDGRRSMKCLLTSSVKVLEEMSESLKESFEVRLTSVLQSQFDSHCAVDDVHGGTVSSSFLKKQDFGDLSTVQILEQEGVEQEKRCWRVCAVLRGRPVPVRLEGIVANQVDQRNIDHEEQQHH